MRIGVKRLLSCIEGFLYHMEECVPLGRGASGDRGEQGTYMPIPILCISQLQKLNHENELNFGAPFVENQN